MTDKPATPPSKTEPGKDAAKAKTGTEKKHASPVHKKKAASKPGIFAGHYLAKLALVTTLLLAAGLYYVWQNQTNQVRNFTQHINRLDQQVAQADKHIADTGSKVRTQINETRQQQKELADALADMLRTNRHLRQDWLRAEAEYLVNLAGHRLLLSRDVDTAIAALQAADDRLLDAGDPSLIPIRKAIAEDITTLKSVNMPDITGLSLKLSALLGEVNHLRLNTPRPEPEKVQDEENKQPPVETWSELPGAIWDDIKGLVTIRDHQGPIKPLLSPEQHFFLTQNLKLQLEQARLALLSGETRVYQERLDTVKTWLENWFDMDDHKNQQVLQELQTIRSVNIRPELPNLSHSQQAFKHYKEQQSIPKASKKKPVEENSGDLPNPVLPPPTNKQVPL